jgi:uncharacterized protein YndB with AHSA1/START domain
MATIHHQLVIDAPVARVYAAIATADAISTWWDKQTPRQTDGVVLEHNPGAEHGIVQLRVVDPVENARIEWECVSTHPPSIPASALTGTHFVFELTPRDERTTTLDFRQTGYDDGSRFFASNREAWRGVLENLKRVAESWL